MKQNVYDGVGLEQALNSGEREKHGVVPTGTVGHPKSRTILFLGGGNSEE